MSFSSEGGKNKRTIRVFFGEGGWNSLFFLRESLFLAKRSHRRNLNHRSDLPHIQVVCKVLNNISGELTGTVLVFCCAIFSSWLKGRSAAGSAGLKMTLKASLMMAADAVVLHYCGDNSCLPDGEHQSLSRVIKTGGFHSINVFIKKQ